MSKTEAYPLITAFDPSRALASNSLTIQDSTGADYMVFSKVSDTETVQVKQNLDIGSNALSMTGNVSAGSASFTGDGASLTLKNDQAEHGNSDAAETTVLFKDHKNNELGKIKGSHHGASDDAKGHGHYESWGKPLQHMSNIKINHKVT